MNVRLRAHAGALLAVGATLLATPTLVRASSGGTTPSGGAAAPAPTSESQPAPVQPGDVPVSASGDGITVQTTASGVLRKPLRFTGNVGSGAAGDRVEIERLGRQTGGRWAPTTHGFAAGDGSFSATWPVNHIGRFEIRAVLESAVSARAASVSPQLTITVFRPSVATQYGPGFYGKRTACGEILRPETLGVANRTLKCGTPVAILYDGRTLVVPVIDRGPYARGVDWDLTEATGRALGISGTATIAAVSLPGTA